MRESPEISQGHSQEILKRSDALIVEAVSENAGWFTSVHSMNWKCCSQGYGQIGKLKNSQNHYQ